MVAFRLSVRIAVMMAAVSAFATNVPDPATGSIHGRVAIMALPVGTAVATEDCTVHLTESGDETREHTYACGIWFQPPVGRYLFWLQRPDEISFQSVIHYAGEPFQTAGLLFTKTLQPAGLVRLDRDAELPLTSTLRLLSLEVMEGFRPFDRRIAAADARREIAMPAGRAIAGIFDGSGKPLALSPPRNIVAGEVTTIRPVKVPEDNAALLAVLNRFISPQSLRHCDARLTVDGKAQPSPDIDFQAYDRVVLVWYRLASAGAARLELRCDGAQLFVRQLRVDKGEISVIRTDLPKAQLAHKEQTP